MSSSRSLRTMAAATPLAVAVILAAAPQASAGLIDGSLNNLHVADKSNILGALLNSHITDLPNNNANTRNDGNRNNSIRAAAPTAMCELTITATDPDGATGTASIAVPPDAAYAHEIQIPDQAPSTKWHVGDVDHLVGQLACSDTETGALVGLVVIDEDETAS